MDLEIREFSNNIVKYINETALPIEVKRLVLHDICQKVDIAADGEIRAQITERDKAEREQVQEAADTTVDNSAEKTEVTEKSLDGFGMEDGGDAG